MAAVNFNGNRTVALAEIGAQQRFAVRADDVDRGVDGAVEPDHVAYCYAHQGAQAQLGLADAHRQAKRRGVQRLEVVDRRQRRTGAAHGRRMRSGCRRSIMKGMWVV